MAYMFPEKPRQFEPNSWEDIMFEALKKLPDDYYVFHSFSVVKVVKNVVHESETDFVIFHPKKGLLCLEAKAGQVNYSDGCWRYGNGEPMAHDGPFHQAASNKWKLAKYMNENGMQVLKSRCKMLHAVWFPGVSIDRFQGIHLPPEADASLMLTREDLEDPTPSIERIFDIKLPNGLETNLSAKDERDMLNRVLAPEFNLVSIPELKQNQRKIIFKTMLKEQVALLNYLEEQNTAVINGLAGTGKTVMAVKKAQIHADRGEKVLFLCYNAYLKEHLRSMYREQYQNIEFYTIDGLACKLCKTPTADYDQLRDVLETMYIEGTFPYKHVVIDEGQDFGKDRIDDTEIIGLLKSLVVDDESRHGTFYLFYDRNQMIQSDKIPDYISEADCKLTLYRNCRNTQNIATTSLRLLGSDKKPKLFDRAIEGKSPEMYFAETKEQTIAAINMILRKCWENGYQDIQLLTCKTEEKSIIASECSDGIYMYQSKSIPFTTCRKYKGLEADVVILIDMGRDMFAGKNEQIMYVGASRARFELFMVTSIGHSECMELLEDSTRTKNPEKALAAFYNAKFRKIESGV